MLLKNKFLPYIAYLAFFFLIFIGIIKQEGFSQYIFLVIFCTLLSSVTFVLAVKKYNPIIAWFISFIGLYLGLLMYLYAFKILTFPFSGRSGWGSDKKVQCMNCGCRLTKGLVGAWVPRGVSTCQKLNKSCVAVEIP